MQLYVTLCYVISGHVMSIILLILENRALLALSCPPITPDGHTDGRSNILLVRGFILPPRQHVMLQSIIDLGPTPTIRHLFVYKSHIQHHQADDRPWKWRGWVSYPLTESSTVHKVHHYSVLSQSRLQMLVSEAVCQGHWQGQVNLLCNILSFSPSLLRVMCVRQGRGEIQSIFSDHHYQTDVASSSGAV